MAKANEPWDENEIYATVNAYFAIRQGTSKSTRKSDAYRELNARFPERTVKAFEYKFQNISAVLADLGEDWLPGVAPARNYQGALRAEVERALKRL